MKKILGLDLGTNSIGWAIVNANEETRENGTKYLKPTGISAAGSRIIPMSQDILGKFDAGNSISQTAERTRLRMMRRLRERNILRRERLLRTLKIMGFLPEHFAQQVNLYGKFIDDSEPKLAWKKKEDGSSEFLFQDSFRDMLADFAMNQPQLVSDDKKVPYDWTIYFLRKKALTERITKEELAWILLHFNQKRGYYQLRGEEEEEKENESVEIISAKILSVEKKEKDKKYEKYWYEMNLDNGMTYRASFYNDVSNWQGDTRDFVLKTTILKDGSAKNELSFLPTTGEIERMDAQRKAKMYAKIKLRTEKDIENSNTTVGCYIYNKLLQKPDQKIIGKLVRTVERKFYKDELILILNTQQEFIPELKDTELYQRCIEELYPSNEAHRNNIAKPDFVNLFVDDILFYQRPLKSKKSLIDNCPYEFHSDKDGNIHPIKCIAKSNPLFQEFRLWQFVQNLRIYQRERIVNNSQFDLFGNTPKGKLQTDVDVTTELLKNEDDYVRLFDWLNDRNSIKQDTLLNSFFKIKKEKGKDKYPFRWNYVEDKEYPCNETRAALLSGLEKCNIHTDFLTHDKEMALWHILYSVEDKAEIGKALKTFASKKGLEDSFVAIFSKLKPFKKEYGSYSEKAIKKLLPLIRMGNYWKAEAIDNKTLDRIKKIITGEYDETIKTRVREKAINFTDVCHFRGLPVWLACYIVYDRHSESKEIEKWESPDDIDHYLRGFKQHSLRNPIVEQIITETLRTVRDIWKQEGRIDEIHVELGREMKMPADKRKKQTERILQNENTNIRIKALLLEFMDSGVENVRPYSPNQQEILRIYEENALDNLTKEDTEYEFVTRISKTAQPSKSDIIRYKCWLEQKYRSPYTGEMIPLSKLFTPAYEIEHIIPQSRYFDDSFSNKVICEAEVNKLKDRQLGYEFIKNHAGQIVQLTQGGTVKIQTVDVYERFVKDHYSTSGIKMKKLLMADIPDDFIERQMNDSRYISKFVKGVLSNIVREKQENGEYEQEAVSKNLISCNGSITTYLKRDWGMENVWNSIILPRFLRLNQLTGTDCFTKLNNEGHTIPIVPFELQKGFNKKRIDHRHHAMDAIVIACATRDHVNLLNNEAAHSKHNANRYQLQRKLRRFEKIVINGKEREIAREFLKPWESFTTDAKHCLEQIIVSFKQNLRVINKTTNYYQHFDDNGKKEYTKQEDGSSWAIRKSMHKDTIFGEVNLRFIKTVSLNEAIKKPETIVNKEFKTKVKELLRLGYNAKSIQKYVEENKDVWSDIKLSKIEVYYYTNETNERYFATRFLSELVTYMDGVTKAEDAIKKIEAITDTGIQKIMKAHLLSKNNNPLIAFSADGIDEMNHNIVALNKGKFHHPIYKVRRFEKGSKFAIGQIGNKTKKFVEADDGTNLFFVVYEDTNRKRFFATIPLNLSIDCQKDSQKKWVQLLDERLRDKTPIEHLQKYQKLDIPTDVHLLFIISPNDLIYVPTREEILNGIMHIDTNRIYKAVSFNKKQCFCILNNVATPIVNKVEFSSSNKMEKTITGEMIKEICIPLKVDRLGNIIKVGY
jgi:CRISPR-associated endonuclease Csn1